MPQDLLLTHPHANPLDLYLRSQSGDESMTWAFHDPLPSHRFPARRPAVVPPGHLNTDGKSGFADYNPLWLLSLSIA
jgi:hypothetical protein